MSRTLLRLLTAIRLTRLTMAFGAVCDLWFIILYTRARDEYVMLEQVREMPLASALIIGAVIAIGLFAYGAALNDILDVRHDSLFSPQRPIPAGHIRLGQAIVVAVGALLISTLAASTFGDAALRMTLLVATGILFYNAAGKFIPGVGVVTVGLIHAAHMLIANHELTFTLPVWLVLTHTLVIAVLVHQYEDKRPRFSRRSLIAVVVAWLFWSMLIIGAGMARKGTVWPDHVPGWRAVYPVLAVIGFIAVARWKTTAARTTSFPIDGADSDREGEGGPGGGVGGIVAAEKLKRYGAMWQALYGAAWLLAIGLHREALWIGGFALTGFLAMTLIKEITGHSDRPVTWRG